MNHKILPSILSCDLGNIINEIEQVQHAGADWLHVDVMDGHFVPNMTFGPVIIQTLKRYFPEMKLDVHLMITNAEDVYLEYINAGADMLTVHIEAVTHLNRLLQQIKEKGIQAGIVINPSTPLVLAKPVLTMIDIILIMSVNPGFAAQMFIPDVLDKIDQLAEIKKNKNLKYIIEMDGGINNDTIGLCLKHGAEWLVAGHAVFGNKKKIKESYSNLMNV